MEIVDPAPNLTARGAATRERIVQAAADLMYADGVVETGLDAVLAASATSKSQLYHYFSDKDDLVLAVIRCQTERVLAGQRTHLHALDSLAGLRAWCDALIEMQRRRHCLGGCPIGSLAAELAGQAQAREALVESFSRWESYLAAGFGAMRDCAELAPEADPAALATAVMSALQGGLLLSQTTRSTRPLELALEMALGHVAAWRG